MARYLEGGAEFIQQHISFFFTRNGSFLLVVNRGEERSLSVCILAGYCVALPQVHPGIK